MKVLIINLTRMGDLLQTMGLISSVKKRFADATIDILVMKAFSPIVNNMSHIDNVITFDEEIFSQNIADDIWGSYTALHGLIATLNQNRYDVVLNPVVSQQSAIITYLVNAPQKLGQQITVNREQKMSSDAIAYLLSNQHNLGDYSFNLVDIFASMVKDIMPADVTSLPAFTDYHLKQATTNDDKISTFLTQIKSHHKKIIGFQVGSSESNKSWNLGYFHAVIERLAKTNQYCIVLFGGYKELDYKDYFKDIQSDCLINTIGDFNLDQLITAISHIDLLVTNDTGPMHIAAARDIPILDISLGPVSKWETGPYNPKAIVIEAKLDCHPCSFTHQCPHWNCHRIITPDIVYNLIIQLVGDGWPNPLSLEGKGALPEYALRGGMGDFATSGRLEGNGSVHLTSDPLFENVNIYTTTKDQFGFLTCKPVKTDTISEKQLIFHLKRFIWSLYFTNELKNPDQYLKTFQADLQACYNIPALNLSPYTTTLASYKDQITRIIANLKKVKNNRNNQPFIKNVLVDVKRQKTLLFDEAKSFVYIYDWFWFMLLKESEIEDTDVVSIVEKTIALYDILLTKISLLLDLFCRGRMAKSPFP